MRNHVLDSKKGETKPWVEKIILRKNFQEGEKVLLYESGSSLFLEKLLSRWKGPYTVVHVYHQGTVRIKDERNAQEFKVNGHRIKRYQDDFPAKMKDKDQLG